MTAEQFALVENEAAFHARYRRNPELAAALTAALRLAKLGQRTVEIVSSRRTGELVPGVDTASAAIEHLDELAQTLGLLGSREEKEAPHA